jgi:hypothetical protein
MALTQYTAPTNIIETLGLDPEDRTTLNDDTFRAKFDQNAVNIAAFLNSLISELASISAGKGASAIGLQDSAGRFTATQVEAALAEIAGTGRTTETIKGLADSKEDALTSFVDDTASRTLALTDARKKLRANHASVAINYTVPPNSNVAFPIGTWIIIEQTGVAQVAIVAGSGVTINPSTKLKINGQYTSAVLIKEAADVWSWQGSVKV